MRVIILRHAEAFPVGHGDIRTDAARFLTERGREQARRAGLALTALEAEPTRIFSSILVRAWQTAETVAEQLAGEVEPEPLEALAPGDFDGVVTALAGVADSATVLLVGHQPFMGELLTLLVTVPQAAAEWPLGFPKAAMGCIALDTGNGYWGRGDLKWFLNRRVIRKLAASMTGC